MGAFGYNERVYALGMPTDFMTAAVNGQAGMAVLSWTRPILRFSIRSADMQFTSAASQNEFCLENSFGQSAYKITEFRSQTCKSSLGGARAPQPRTAKERHLYSGNVYAVMQSMSCVMYG